MRRREPEEQTLVVTVMHFLEPATFHRTIELFALHRVQINETVDGRLREWGCGTVHSSQDVQKGVDIREPIAVPFLAGNERLEGLVALADGLQKALWSSGSFAE